MSAERALTAALDAAAAPVRFWWRDDDAGADDERLADLLRLADARGAAVALAVVPGWLEGACVERILASSSATVVQHGIAHADHSAPPAKRVELGGLADREALASGLRRGRERLAQAFGARFVAALVPPWNRIAPDLVATLPRLGFVGLSTFGRREGADAAPGLRRINTHLDLVRWREGALPLELEPALEALARLVEACADEPIGILTHHKVMPRRALAVLDRILALVQDHPRATLAAAGALFGEGR